MIVFVLLVACGSPFTLQPWDQHPPATASSPHPTLCEGRGGHRALKWVGVFPANPYSGCRICAPYIVTAVTLKVPSMVGAALPSAAPMPGRVTSLVLHLCDTPPQSNCVLSWFFCIDGLGQKAQHVWPHSHWLQNATAPC